MARKSVQRQIRPSRIYQTVTALLNHRIQPQLQLAEPAWYKAVGSIPPSETVTRPLPPQHRAPPGSKVRKASRLFQPQQLVYEEDALRTQFYKDHPWELARPRMIIEMDGRDAQRCDWSKGLRQPGVPLSGESVVQRQLWRMHNIPGMSKEEAYDLTRKEFYRLRQEEEIEKRVAKEEARMVGAYFGQGYLQIGMQLENLEHERWKKWAAKEIDNIRIEQDDSSSSPVEEATDLETNQEAALDELMSETIEGMAR
ncbi:37S ribosomal protein S25 [Xylariales sp. PMI_506]|nr:37S ribosomal protein S25 [Xylariales sp. PMI_506]